MYFNPASLSHESTDTSHHATRRYKNASLSRAHFKRITLINETKLKHFTISPTLPTLHTNQRNETNKTRFTLSRTTKRFISINTKKKKKKSFSTPTYALPSPSTQSRRRPILLILSLLEVNQDGYAEREDEGL